MKYRVVTKDAFAITGKSADIPFDSKYTMLPRFWKECKADGTIARLNEISGGGPIIGAGENGEERDSFRYIIGVEAEKPDIVSFDSMVIPGSEWIVFEPVLSEPKYVGTVWNYIFSVFLPNGNYRLASTPDLEVNHQIGADRYSCEIWIPVIQKS